MKKVIIGLSGGVDSSVSAWLLQEQGFEVEALFMKNWEADDTDTFCPAAQDLADATAVCQTLDIPLHTVNFSQRYWDKVFTYFLDEYAKGRTPNPDFFYNKEIKFNAFLDYAIHQLDADWIATGHYARMQHQDTESPLMKAKDREKDQTYFLHAVSRDALKKTLFPLGDYLKTDIRDLAKKLNLITHDKKDSTGICFIGERRFKSFLNEFLLAQPGLIESATGEQLGEHDGLMFYTYGQRQGLKIGGKKNTDGRPWFVVDKQLETNTLIVAQGAHHPMLYSQALMCGPIHWLTRAPPLFSFACKAKTRYRQPEQACLISPETSQGHHCVHFSTPQRAITPGQSIVFYHQQQCLGGAVIESMIR